MNAGSVTRPAGRQALIAPASSAQAFAAARPISTGPIWHNCRSERNLNEGKTVDPTQQLCPYIERRDARCAGTWTLTNLREAMGRCAGKHEFCSVYHRIRCGDPPRDFRALSASERVTSVDDGLPICVAQSA